MVSDFPFSLEKLTYIGNLMIFVQTNWFGMQHGSIKFGSTSDFDEIFIISLCIQAETPYCIQFSFVALFGTQKKKDKRISQEFRMLTLQERYLFFIAGTCELCMSPLCESKFEATVNGYVYCCNSPLWRCSVLTSCWSSPGLPSLIVPMKMLEIGILFRP